MSLFTAVISSTISLNAQHHKNEKLLPFDIGVIVNKLPNGFTYYIQENDKDSIIDIRFVVRVGSFMEDKLNYGASHLIEHLAFEGTRSFPGDSIKNIFGEAGLRTGDDWRGSTLDKGTVYTIRVKSSDTSLFKKALLITRDWADQISFEEERIKAQQGAVYREFAGVNSESFLLRKDINSDILSNKLYSAATYILQGENTFQLDKVILQKFYRTWYQPENESIIISGPVSAKEVEKEIQYLFSNIPCTKQSDYKPFVLKKSHRGTEMDIRVLQYKDRTRNNYAVEIYSKISASSSINSIEDIERSVMYDFYNRIGCERFFNLRKQYNSKFKDVAHSLSNIGPGRSNICALTTSFIVDDSSEIQEAIKQIFKLVFQIKKSGFTEYEFNTIKKIITEKQIAVSERGKDKFINHFVYGDAASPDRYIDSLKQTIVSTLTIKRLNNFVRKFMVKAKAIDVVVIVPDSHDSLRLSSKDISSLLVASNKQNNSTLISKQLTPALLVDTTQTSLKGKVLTDTIMNGVRLLGLSNGIKLVVYKTESAVQGNNRYVSLLGSGQFKYDGLRCDESIVSMLKTSHEAVMYAGMGQWNKFAIEDFKEDNNIMYSSYIEGCKKIISASCSVDKLEEALQLVYTGITAPRKDSVAFSEWKRMSNENISSKKEDLDIDSVIDSLKFDKHSINVNELKNLSLDDVYSNYNQIYSHNNFTFFIVTNCKEETLISKSALYLGSIPSCGNLPDTFDLSTLSKLNSINSVTYSEPEGSARIKIFIPGILNNNNTEIRNVLELGVLGEVLRESIFDQLRTKLGGSYTPSGGCNFALLPGGGISYDFQIDIETFPQRVSEMLKAAIGEFTAISEGKRAYFFKKALEIYKTNIQNDISGGFTAIRLKEYYLAGFSPDAFYEQISELNKIEEDDLVEAAKRYMTNLNYQVFISMPKTSEN